MESLSVFQAETQAKFFFSIESPRRIFALRPKIFFSRKSWFNVVDFCIVAVTFASGVAHTVIARLSTDVEICKGTWGTVRILVILRVFRFFRLLRMLRLFTEHYQLKKAFRQKVSQVKCSSLSTSEPQFVTMSDSFTVLFGRIVDVSAL